MFELFFKHVAGSVMVALDVVKSIKDLGGFPSYLRALGRQRNRIEIFMFLHKTS